MTLFPIFGIILNPELKTDLQTIDTYSSNLILTTLFGTIIIYSLYLVYRMVYNKKSGALIKVSSTNFILNLIHQVIFTLGGIYVLKRYFDLNSLHYIGITTFICYFNTIINIIMFEHYLFQNTRDKNPVLQFEKASSLVSPTAISLHTILILVLVISIFFTNDTTANALAGCSIIVWNLMYTLLGQKYIVPDLIK